MKELDETIKVDMSPLPWFDPQKICEKCGTVPGAETPLAMTYCVGSDPNVPYQKDRCRAGVGPEHFHRSCTTCGYSWVESTFNLSSLHVPEGQQWPPYDPSNPCVKCGLTPVRMMRPQTKWCKGGKDCLEGLKPDHMHRICIQCGYRWAEACLNEKLVIGTRG